MDLSLLFPKAQSARTGCIKLDARQAKYSDIRYGDTLEKEGQPIGTITKIGRKFWTRSLEFGPLSYSVNASFPRSYNLKGGVQDIKARIGNSVPPPTNALYRLANKISYVWRSTFDPVSINYKLS